MGERQRDPDGLVPIGPLRISDSDPDRALKHLARASAANPKTREWAATDPDLDPIRSDPRYPGQDGLHPGEASSPLS